MTISARPPGRVSYLKLYANYPLGHERPFHGLNPQESARNHGYGTSGVSREAAANRALEYTYKYL
jgi:hypothetical protein